MSFYLGASHARQYNKFRPSPPPELAQRIVKYLKEKVSLPLEKAIDVGCGGGQCTQIFAPYFKKVEGVDPSEVQIVEANENNKFPNITYRVGYAEKIDCTDSSVQLVTASQASHWFDLPKFYAEVNRILVPGGVLSLLGYMHPVPKHANQIKDLFPIVEKMFNKTLWEFNHPESLTIFEDHFTSEKFTNIPFIKDPLVRDEFIMTKSSSSIDELVGYVVSLSGFQKLERNLGDAAASKVIEDFTSELMDAIDTKLSPNEVKIDIEYKYFLMMARKP